MYHEMVLGLAGLLQQKVRVLILSRVFFLMIISAVSQV